MNIWREQVQHVAWYSSVLHIKQGAVLSGTLCKVLDEDVSSPFSPTPPPEAEGGVSKGEGGEGGASGAFIPLQIQSLNIVAGCMCV